MIQPVAHVRTVWTITCVISYIGVVQRVVNFLRLFGGHCKVYGGGGVGSVSDGKSGGVVGFQVRCGMVVLG